jgi:hypothetical protein
MKINFPVVIMTVLLGSFFIWAGLNFYNSFPEKSALADQCSGFSNFRFGMKRADIPKDLQQTVISNDPRTEKTIVNIVSEVYQNVDSRYFPKLELTFFRGELIEVNLKDNVENDFLEEQNKLIALYEQKYGKPSKSENEGSFLNKEWRGDSISVAIQKFKGYKENKLSITYSMFKKSLEAFVVEESINKELRKHYQKQDSLEHLKKLESI